MTISKGGGYGTVRHRDDIDDGPDSSSSSAIGSIQDEPKRSWKSYLWDTFDKSPEERRFLFKLDVALMTLASLGYFMKYLDQVNINNAFISGMKEDMGLFGNELNYMQTFWTIGYVIGEIPRSDLVFGFLLAKSSGLC
ncbi:hypothetical protein V2G26_005141 [Clonostachys chloroleuca]